MEGTLLQELKEQIGAEINLVQERDAPYVYAMSKTTDGYANLENRIAEKVLSAGKSIDEAIQAIENEINPNRID